MFPSPIRTRRAIVLGTVLLSLLQARCGYLIVGAIIPLYQPIPVCLEPAGDEIVTDGDPKFDVPDQQSGGCNSVQIARAFVDGSEAELIRAAEQAPSTIGDDWWAPAGIAQTDLRVAQAITTDSLRYFVERARGLERDFALRSTRSGLVYNASVETASAPPEGVECDGGCRTVMMELYWYEGSNALVSAGYGEYLMRRVVFNASGEIVSISGDGPGGIAVVN